MNQPRLYDKSCIAKWYTGHLKWKDNYFLPTKARNNNNNNQALSH